MNFFKIINYISSATIPFIIIIAIIFGLQEKKDVFNEFIDGTKAGIKVVYNIFPSLIGIFLAVGALRSSGILDFIIKYVSPITNIIGIPKEIMPLILIRPISGSATIAISTDIMTRYGVDSKIGLIASTIMGSTETTLYIISIYATSLGIKKINYVLYCALIADVVGIMVSVLIWNAIL